MRKSKIVVVFRNGNNHSFDIAKENDKDEFEKLKNALINGVKFYVFSNSVIRLDEVINIYY